MQKEFSPQESLQLIQSMISSARTNISEKSFYFLIWGWFTFIAILLQFFLKVVFNYSQHYLVWWGVFPVALFTIVYARKHRSTNTKTFIGESMGSLWTGIGISFFVLSFIISNMHEGGNWLNAYPFFIMFYGLGTFVSGKILQFKPLVVGGILNWVLACVCLFFSYDYQLLFAAGAILTSYIIPGHLLKRARS